MELAHLRYLVAVPDELNFTRAAARSHVTQQSLSAGIARLDRIVGTPLVDRTTPPRRAHPPPAKPSPSARAGGPQQPPADVAGTC